MAIVAQRPTQVEESQQDDLLETIMAVTDLEPTTTTTTPLDCVMTSFPTKPINSTPNSIDAMEGELPPNHEMPTTSLQQQQQQETNRQEQPSPVLRPQQPQQQRQQVIVAVQTQVPPNEHNNKPIPVVSHAPVTNSACVRPVIVPTPPSGMFHSPHSAGGYITRIRTPHPHDVLCGRGGGINGHPGNRRFRAWVRERKAAYNGTSVSKTEKARIARDVVDLVRSLRPPGRFLTREEYSSGGTPAFGGSMLVTGGGFWVEIDTVKALTKTSQALREGAPSIRATTVRTPLSVASQITSPTPGAVTTSTSTAQVATSHVVSTPAAAPAPPQNVTATPAKVLSSGPAFNTTAPSIPPPSMTAPSPAAWTTPPLVSNRHFASKVSASSGMNSATVSDNDDDDHRNTGDEPPAKRQRNMSTDIVFSAPENASSASTRETVPTSSEIAVDASSPSSSSETISNASRSVIPKSSSSSSEKQQGVSVTAPSDSNDTEMSEMSTALPSCVMEELRRIAPTSIVAKSGEDSFATVSSHQEGAKETTPTNTTNIAGAPADHLEFVNPFDTAEERAMLQVVADLLKEKEGNSTCAQQEPSLMSTLADFPFLE